MIAGQFGQRVPVGSTYDLMPRLAPDGIVDIQDISFVAGQFGRQCLGSSGTDNAPAVAGISSLTTCSWWADNMPRRPSTDPDGIVLDYSGLLRCFTTYVPPISIGCFTQVEKSLDGGATWLLVASTGGSYYHGGACWSADFTIAPKNVMLRQKLCYTIYDTLTGAIVAGDRCVAWQFPFLIPT